MNPENERIELLFPGRKRCMMLKHQYEIVCEFLLEKMKDREKVTLTELLDSAEQNLVNRIKGNLSWTVLQVKQDLEARGLIVISHEKNRVQVISLKKSARKKLNMVGGFLLLKEHAEEIGPLVGIKVWHLSY